MIIDRSVMLSFTILILFGAAFQSTSGQDCPVHEELVECIDLCNTCEPCWQRNPNLCIPGCDCIPGYSRTIEGYCVPRQFCQELNTETLPNHGCPNETRCDLICKRLAYTSGRCEGPDKLNCICYRCGVPSLAISDAGVQGISLPPILSRDILRSCGCPNTIECALNCKRRGYRTGVCEGDFCRCISPIPPVYYIGCPDENKCLSMCRSQGYIKSICIGEGKRQCECTVPFPNDASPARDLEGCDAFNCASVCKTLGYPSGICINSTTCQCSRKSRAIDFPNDASPARDLEDCNAFNCASVCKTLGYPSGICINSTTCQCSRKSRAIDFPLIPPRDVLQSCGCPNAIECASNCRRRGYQDGVCEGNFCRCIGPFSSIDVTGCPDESQCVGSCLRFGFKTGLCDDLKCQCLERKPACFYFEAFEEENGKKCQSGPCHRRCKEQGYRYGLCLSADNQICCCFKQTD